MKLVLRFMVYRGVPGGATTADIWSPCARRYRPSDLGAVGNISEAMAHSRIVFVADIPHRPHIVHWLQSRRVTFATDSLIMSSVREPCSCLLARDGRIVHVYTVETTGEPRRDVFLFEALPQLSRARVQALIKEGAILLNGVWPVLSQKSGCLQFHQSLTVKSS